MKHQRISAIPWSGLSIFKTLVVLFSMSMIEALGSSFSGGQNQCSHYYSATHSSAQEKPLVFAPEKEPEAGVWDTRDFYYPFSSNKIFNNTETRNLDQRGSRKCFLFSFLGALETTHLNRQVNARSIKLSPAYLVARHFEHVIHEVLSNNARSDYFKLEGGELYHAMKLVDLYGLVPEDIWIPRVPFEKWDFPAIYDQIFNALNIVINDRNAHPENYRNFDLQAKAQSIFKTILEPWVGNFPKPFEYDGIWHTTQSFGKLYGFDQNGSIEIKYANKNGPYLQSVQTSNLPYFINPLLKKHQFQTTHKPESTQEIFEAVRIALGQDKAVIIDIDGFIKGIGDNYQDPIIGHQLVITDVELFGKGPKVKALKLKHNYDDKWRNNGYAWVSAKQLGKFLRRVWIFDVNKDIPPPRMNSGMAAPE